MNMTGTQRAGLRCWGLCVLLLLGMPLAGCVAYKGPRLLANVSAYDRIVPTPRAEQPVCVDFEFHGYANEEPRRGQSARHVHQLRSALLETLQGSGFAYFTDRYPSSDFSWALQVSLKEDVRVDPAGFWGYALTLCLLPYTEEIRYEVNAELLDGNGKPFRSYLYNDSYRVTHELFLIVWVPFNRDYQTRITDNLYKQLAIDLERDLRGPAAK